MILYHGSNTSGIHTLEPKIADHGYPYVYMSTSEVVAAFYMCNAVEKPYYWFPYGFEKESNIPIYHELYPNALREVSSGVKGSIYETHPSDDQIIPFKNNPYARLGITSIEIVNCTEVNDAYELFMDYVDQGKMKIGKFEEKSTKELEWWNTTTVDYIREKEMINTPNCSYAMFVKKNLPHIWERYINNL